MTEREQREKLMIAMSAAYSEPEVKKDPQIQQLIFDLAKQLSKGRDAHAVYYHLSQELRGYALGNDFKMPKSLSNLYEMAQDSQKDYRKSYFKPFWKK
ncbi:MAG: bacteriocin immunity protein [Tetragenococcus koreensis]|nr:bacteriocin immunity protein [Tetragenococcus koreensis]